MKLFLKLVVTRRWGWPLIGALVLLTGVLWGVSSPTVSYIGPPGDPTTHLSTTIAKNGDVYIYPTDKSMFFIARHDDFSSPIKIPHKDILALFSALPNMISVNDTIGENLHVTQAHVIEMLELDNLDKTQLATYTASDYNSSGVVYENRWWPGAITLMAVGLLIACVALFVRRKTSAGGQKEENPPKEQPIYNRTNIFISYSHKDAKYLSRLRTHVIPHERDKSLDVWDDTKISVGALWQEEIEKALKQAKIAILLVSADFLASKFIAENELPPLLAAAEAGGARILPIILSPCGFENTELAKFQAMNPPSRPLTGMNGHQREDLWAKVAEIISK